MGLPPSGLMLVTFEFVDTEAEEPDVEVCCALLHLRPQALQRFLFPLGPRRHSGESWRPQLAQVRTPLAGEPLEFIDPYFLFLFLLAASNIPNSSLRRLLMIFS